MSERRLGYRIPFDSIVTSYVHDRTVRALVSNISDTGINMSSISALAPWPGTVVGLEIDLPGLGESIWASGRVCYRKRENLTSGLGVKFVAMASSQARIVRDYCIEMRRGQLAVTRSASPNRAISA